LRLIHVCLVAGALSLLAPLSLRAEEGATPGVAWVEGFAAGQAAGKERGKLLFVYVGRKTPPCPPCRALEAGVWSKPDSARIQEVAVPVRILGGADLDDAGRVFMERYGVQGFPTLMALTPDGAVLDGDLTHGRLGEWIEDPAGAVTAIVEGLAAAQAREDAFRAEAKALAEKTDRESLVRLGDLHAERMDPASARTLYEKALAAGPTVDVHLRLAEILAATGDTAGETKVLDEMIAGYPEHADRIEWRIRRATIDLPQGAADDVSLKILLDSYVERYRALAAKIAEEGKKSDEAAVRVRLSNLLLQREDPVAARAEVAWVLEHAGDSPYAADAYAMLAMLAEAPPEAAGHLKTLLEKFPKHPHAIHAHLRLFEMAMAEGDPETGAKHLEAVIRDFPESREAGFAAQILPQIRAPQAPPVPGGGGEGDDGSGAPR
jgi:tetratricopeptide (TPR) repeat protein